MRPANVSIDSEQTVIGGVLLDEMPAYQKVAGVVRASDFFLSAHQIIFTMLGDLVTTIHRLDPLTVAEQLDLRGELEDGGGLEYLAKLCMQTASTSYIHVYAQQVADCARRRRIMAAAARVAAGDLDALAALMQEAA